MPVKLSLACLQSAILGGRGLGNTGHLMRNSAAYWTSWTKPAGVPTPQYSWADGGAELGMAAGTGMLQGRWLLLLQATSCQQSLRFVELWPPENCCKTDITVCLVSTNKWMRY